MSAPATERSKGASAVISHPTDAERRALREAAAWHTRLRDQTAAAANDHRAWQDWHAADPAHQRAWQKVQAVGAQLGRIPAPLARQALGERSRPPRRAVLRSLAAGVGVGSAALLSWRTLPWQEWQATHRTAVGERRDITLPDGSLLALDTGTAVDVDFTDRERLLRLRTGRILVATQPDAQGRRFSVVTSQGRVVALGTRFSVQLQGDSQCHVSVQEKAVRVLPAEGMPRELQAGEQTRFTPLTAEPPVAADPFDASWRDGGLIAVDMPLGTLIAALARYRPGHLGCAPEVAAVRVSGAFPVNDTDRALAALVSRFPLQLRSHTRYWVRVEALERL